MTSPSDIPNLIQPMEDEQEKKEAQPMQLTIDLTTDNKVRLDFHGMLIKSLDFEPLVALQIGSTMIAQVLELTRRSITPTFQDQTERKADERQH